MDVPVAQTRWNGVQKTLSISKTKDVAKIIKDDAKVSRGRGGFYDKVVKAVVKENPRKTGTRAWHIFEIIMANKGGINYELLIEKSKEFDILKAGVREDVAHDLKKGRVELV